MTVTQADHDSPKALLSYRTYNQPEAWKHIAAQEIMIHRVDPPVSLPLHHPVVTIAPAQLPSASNATPPQNESLRIKLRPIIQLDAYELMECPYGIRWKTSEQLSVGTRAFWDSVELRIIGIRHIYENIVIFIAQEVTTLFTIEMWTPKQWATVTRTPPHWMFKDCSNKPVAIPPPIPEQFVAI